MRGGTRESMGGCALVNKKWTRRKGKENKGNGESGSDSRRTGLAELLGRQIIQGIGWTLLIKEKDVVIDFILNRLFAGYV